MKLQDIKNLLSEWLIESGWKLLEFFEDGSCYSIECYKIFKTKTHIININISKEFFNYWITEPIVNAKIKEEFFKTLNKKAII